MEDKIMNSTQSTNIKKQHSIALTNCLEPLLKALGWPGERRHLIEAVPYFSSALDLHDFLHAMKVLRYQHNSFKINLKFLNPALVPCLFISQSNQVLLILDMKDNYFTIFDGLSLTEKKLYQPSLRGRVYYFQRISNKELIINSVKNNWFKGTLKEFYNIFIAALFISFALNMLTLSVPLFSMVIYDKVIPSESLTILNTFIIGITIAFVGIAVLQYIQSKIISYLGAKINNIIGNAVLEHLLLLPAIYTESASVSSQVSRIRDFDNIRNFFTGPLFKLFFDLPFIIIFLAAIAILGGSLAFIPLIMMSIYFILFSFLRQWINLTIERGAQYASNKQEITLEALQHLRTLKYTGSISTWCKRYRNVSAQSALANFKTNMAIAFVNIMSDLLMMLTTVAVISLGAFKIMEGSMTMGALIAIMMLTWRVLSPLKIFFANQTRLNQVRSSIRQVNTLMTIETEREPSIIATPLNHFQGSVRFNRVTVRYPQSQDPALMNVSFNVNPGEVVAITGRNGSGKSTVFKVLLGLYKPQAGSILIDNQDIRQMDPFELRNAIGYVPQKPAIFYGTIAQNLYLANPIATEEELYQAIKFANLSDDISALPHQLETQLDDQSIVNFPSSFMQRLSLAQNYLKRPSIILLDEPANTLDSKGEQALLKAIEYFRGSSTIFTITHRPSHIKLADKIILLHEGQLLLAGQTSQILARLPKEFIQ